MNMTPYKKSLHLNFVQPQKSNLLLFNTALISDYKEGVKEWLSFNPLFHWNLPLIDRTCSLKLPYRLSLSKYSILPELSGKCIPFTECLHMRVKEILSYDKPIILAFSGGIDSTLVLSVLHQYDLKDRLVVALTPESIIESPQMFEYIKKVYKFISTYEIDDYLDTHQLIICDPGCRNFNGIIPENEYSKQKATIENMWVLSSKVPSTLLFNAIKESSTHYVELKTVRDFSWWFHMNFRWQAVGHPRWTLRLKQRSRRFWEDNLHVFFNSHDIQRWSVYEGRFLPDIKQMQKQLIRNVFPKYSINKSKFFSTSALFAGQPYHEAIDENYKTYSKINIDEYYQSNDFKTLAK